jgi:hypothetical protein
VTQRRVGKIAVTALQCPSPVLAILPTRSTGRSDRVGTARELWDILP